MTNENTKLLVQLSVRDLQQLIKEAVKDELQMITSVVQLNPREKNNEPELLTRKQTAELLKVSETTLFLWNRDKVLEHKKLNNRVYYLRSNVMNKLNSVA